MQKVAKKLRSRALFFWLSQPLGIILVSSLIHLKSCQAKSSPSPRLSLEIISDISRLPNEAVQAFVASVSETTVNPTGCKLMAIENFVYNSGGREKEFTRQTEKAIPLEELTGSEVLSMAEKGRIINFSLETHRATTGSGLVSYSLTCYIATDQLGLISDLEVLSWSLKDDRGRRFPAFLSELKSSLVNALMMVIANDAIYQPGKKQIGKLFNFILSRFEPIKKHLFGGQQ